MTYVNAVKYIASLPDGEANIERAHKVRELLSSDNDKVRTIHVLGSQGKNSCQRMLSSILEESGIKVGGFSPSHAIEPRDAITINSKPVPYDLFADTLEELKCIYSSNADLGEPSADEIICLAASVIFERAECDVAIFEKGLKKADAVNMTDPPILSVIASMGELSPDEFDLSDSLRRGTSETVTSPQHKDIYNAISQSCARIGSRLTLSIYSELEIAKINLFKTSFSYGGESYSIRSFSPYQTINAITVIEAAKALIRLGLPITNEHISCGIEKTTFPYKCEAISLEPAIILSSAHNDKNISSLASSIALVSDLIKGDVFIAVEDSCTDDSEKIRSLFAAYGVDAKEIFTLSPVLTPSKLTKKLRGLITPLLEDDDMSSALVLITKKDFAVTVSETVRQILGKI